MIKLYENIKYGGVVDNYEYIGTQEGFGEVKDFELYTGIKYHYTLSLSKILELKGLEKKINE